MGQRILVVAPHADDEVIGCAGLILSSKLKGASVGWLLMTSVEEQYGYSEEFVQTRKKQIETVKELLSFDTFSNLGFHPAYLDTIPKSEIILAMSKVIQRYQPSELYIPYPGDAHSDHGVTFDCCRAFMKPFRYDHVEKICFYETISETDQNFTPDQEYFKPNRFVNISDFIDQKVHAALTYESEFQEHPFPRSEVNIKALAAHRGATANYKYAEAYISLLDRSN